MNAPLPAAAAAAAAHNAQPSAARKAQVLAALRAVLPAHALLHQREDTVPYECDGLTAYRQLPLAVALPETEAQVAAVLKACHAIGVACHAPQRGRGRPRFQVHGSRFNGWQPYHSPLFPPAARKIAPPLPAVRRTWQQRVSSGF